MREKDYKILLELRKNARARLTDMSRRTKIPISTIYDRLMNKNYNAIDKYVSLLNFDILGFHSRAQICLKCPKRVKEDFVGFISNHPNTNSLQRINNGYDFMIEVVFQNIKQLEEFIELLEEKFKITNKQVYYIIDDLIREAFFTDEIHLQMV